MYNGIRFTNNSEIEQIVHTACRILNDYGVLVEHEKHARLILEYSPDKITYTGGRLRIDADYAHDYFLSFQNSAPAKHHPTASAAAEIYEGPYLDPYDHEFKEWNEERLLSYVKLAKGLPDVGSVSMLGCPLPGLSYGKKPLLEKLYSFKYGITGAYAIWDTALCPKILEIWEIYANEKGVPVSDVFQGGVFMISPLRMGYVESEQMLWFKEHGLAVSCGTLSSIGLSSPVTPAGAIAMHIAELLFLSIMHAALYGERNFRLSCSLSVADMRAGSFQYGRPEQVLMNIAMSDLADYYQIPYGSHGGLSDAKEPSFEAGLQKVGSALASVMKGRNGHIVAGLLSVDEVYSPVQMVLDNEAAGYLKRICRGFKVDEESLAMEVIGQCIADGGLFIEQVHTVTNMRECLWTPSVFSGEMFGGWQKDTDAKRARELAISIMEGPALEALISEDCEKRIQKIIDEA